MPLGELSSFMRVRFEGMSTRCRQDWRELTLRTLPGVVQLGLSGSCTAVPCRLAGRGLAAECLAHYLLKLPEWPRSSAAAAVVRAAAAEHERSELLTADRDLNALVRCLHRYAPCS